GRLVHVECARKDLEKEFWEYCHTDENSDRVGELAFGTNLGLSEMIGVLLQDEKFPGVHIAFGDPYGSQTHADWKSKTHGDVLTRNCDVWIDDDQIISKGHYQLDHLGLSWTGQPPPATRNRPAKLCPTGSGADPSILFRSAIPALEHILPRSNFQHH